jgi:hypothetical protein
LGIVFKVSGISIRQKGHKKEEGQVTLVIFGDSLRSWIFSSSVRGSCGFLTHWNLG